MREIVGYAYNGAEYHPQCLPKGIDPNGEEVWAIFSWDSDACIGVCDVCLDFLMECDYREMDDDLSVSGGLDGPVSRTLPQKYQESKQGRLIPEHHSHCVILPKEMPPHLLPRMRALVAASYARPVRLRTIRLWSDWMLREAWPDASRRPVCAWMVEVQYTRGRSPLIGPMLTIFLREGYLCVLGGSS